MSIESERTDDSSIFSFQRMAFRYRYARKHFHTGSVLDIGCGFGYGASFFDERYQYTGIDYYDHAVAIASRDYPHARFQQMRVPPMEFQTDTFDNLMCGEMIKHVEPDVALPLLQECYRILRPGGILFLSTPNGANRKQRSPDHFIEYRVDQIRALLEEAGFSVQHQGGLSIDLLTNRFDGQTTSSRFRAGLYQWVSGGGRSHASAPTASDAQSDTLPAAAPRPGARVIKRMVKAGLTAAARAVIFAGYVFPGKAEYQVWVCVKTS